MKPGFPGRKVGFAPGETGHARHSPVKGRDLSVGPLIAPAKQSESKRRGVLKPTALRESVRGTRRNGTGVPG